jgi:alpha-glucosidase (family GH31 glycosyl hydrolase)
MWGPALLAAPYVSADQAQEVWLPPGKWYDYWHPQMALQGDTVLTKTPDAQQMALYVKAGAILTRQKFALSTAFGDKGTLLLDVYPGADGDALLVEDDDRTEAYRLRGKQMKTSLHYDDARIALQIGGASGTYAGAPRGRAYQLTMHGQPAGSCFTVNGKPASAVHLNAAGETVIEVARTAIRRRVLIQACKAKSEA